MKMKLPTIIEIDEKPWIVINSELSKYGDTITLTAMPYQPLNDLECDLNELETTIKALKEKIER